MIITVPTIVLENTLVGIKSLKKIVSLSQEVQTLEGSIAEVGVYNGGSGLLLLQLNPEKDIYLFDTFQGLPEVTPFDNYHQQSDFDDVSEKKVRWLFQKYSNCHILKGKFPQETGQAIDNLNFKLVHLDVDTYTSYRDSLNFFYSRIIPGGVIIMDDYASKYCLGAKKAIDDFMNDKEESLVLGPERQAHFFKK